MANGQFQGLVADIPGAVQRGLQFRQSEQLRPVEQESARLGLQRQEQQIAMGGLQQKSLQQQINQRTEQQKSVSLVNSAFRLQQTPDSQKLPFLQSQEQEILSKGGDPTETRVGIKLAQEGRFDELNQGIAQIISLGERQGIIKAPSFKKEELALRGEAQKIRHQEVVLRQSESEERSLERKLKHETNEIKKQELQLKLDEKKRQVVQSKKDRTFNAENAIRTVGDSIDTIDRMLAGSALESATGFEANFPTVSGTDASGFESLLDTLQSQAFLSEIEKMKGLGALSENEGKKLAQSVGSLTIEQPDDQLRSELNRIKQQMNKARDKLKTKFGVVGGPLSESEQAELEQLRAELGQ